MRKLLVLCMATLACALSACVSLESHKDYKLASLSDAEVQEREATVLYYLGVRESWQFRFGPMAYNGNLERPTRVTDLETHTYRNYGKEDVQYEFRVFDESGNSEIWMYFHIGKKISGVLTQQSGVILHSNGVCEPHIWLGDQRNICAALTSEQWQTIAERALALSRNVRHQS